MPPKRLAVPTGYQTAGLFGRAQVDPAPVLGARDAERKRKRDEKAAQADEGEAGKKRREGSRNTWKDAYNLKFGSWIDKIPYTDDDGVERYMTGCRVCKEAGRTVGLGPCPTKRLKSCTFTEHEATDSHKDVRH